MTSLSRRREIWFVVPALLSVACTRARLADDRDAGPTLSGAAAAAAADSLARLDVHQELEAALLRGDRRFLGVQGYAIVAPGLPAAEHRALVRQYGIRVIRGTSDNRFITEGEDTIPGGPPVERFHKEAAAWATRYNRALLARLRR